MSVSSTTSRVSYTGNGAVDTYSYTFKIFANTDLLVTVRNTLDVETTLALTTDYSVTGVGETSGGTIVLVNSAQDWLDGDGDLKTGYILVIRRVRPLTQLTDIRNQGDFYPEAHENEFDKQVMIHQQHEDDIGRSVKLPETIVPSTFDPTLPTDIGTAGLIVRVNDTADGFVSGPTSTEIENAEANAIAAAASAVTASEWATLTTALVSATDNSSKAYAIGGTGPGQPTGGDAKSWATKTTATVDGADYSAKEHAKGILTRGLAGGGSAKDWANYTSGTVDNAEYSSKKYATDSSSSAVASAASAAQSAVSASASLWNDVSFKVFSDSPISIVDASAGTLYAIDCTSGNVVVNLPAISALTLTGAWAVGFKKTDASTNTITINRNGTDTIDGSTSLVISTPQSGITLLPDVDPSPDTWTALHWGDVPDDPRALLNYSISVSANPASSHTLVVTLNDKNGSTPSPASPVKFAFRSPTITSGVYQLISASASTSITIPSGTTIGTRSATSETIYIYSYNNGGQLGLALSRGIFNEDTLQTTTAISGGATASVLYSTSVVSNVPIRSIGKIVIQEAAAGTWDTAPTKVSIMPFEINKRMGCAVYKSADQTGDFTSATLVTWDTVIYDDCGFFVDASDRIYCRFSGRVKVFAQLYFAGIGDNTCYIAIKLDTNAIATKGSRNYSGYIQVPAQVTVEVTAGQYLTVTATNDVDTTGTITGVNSIYTRFEMIYERID